MACKISIGFPLLSCINFNLLFGNIFKIFLKALVRVSFDSSYPNPLNNIPSIIESYLFIVSVITVSISTVHGIDKIHKELDKFVFFIICTTSI